MQQRSFNNSSFLKVTEQNGRFIMFSIDRAANYWIFNKEASQLGSAWFYTYITLFDTLRVADELE